jgi:hypothetical protein
VIWAAIDADVQGIIVSFPDLRMLLAKSKLDFETGGIGRNPSSFTSTSAYLGVACIQDRPTPR